MHHVWTLMSVKARYPPRDTNKHNFSEICARGNASKHICKNICVYKSTNITCSKNTLFMEGCKMPMILAPWCWSWLGLQRCLQAFYLFVALLLLLLFWSVLLKSFFWPEIGFPCRCDYINGPRKQYYIQVDITFNYMFHFGPPGTCL